MTVIRIKGKPLKKTTVVPRGANTPNKGKRLARIAKATGTTTGEAKGVMQKVRKKTAAGNYKGARKTLTKALKGGPAGGVPTSASRKAKARKSSAAVVARIRTKQKTSRRPR